MRSVDDVRTVDFGYIFPFKNYCDPIEIAYKSVGYYGYVQRYFCKICVRV